MRGINRWSWHIVTRRERHYPDHSVWHETVKPSQLPLERKLVPAAVHHGGKEHGRRLTPRRDWIPSNNATRRKLSSCFTAGYMNFQKLVHQGRTNRCTLRPTDVAHQGPERERVRNQHKMGTNLHSEKGRQPGLILTQGPLTHTGWNGWKLQEWNNANHTKAPTTRIRLDAY